MEELKQGVIEIFERAMNDFPKKMTLDLSGISLIINFKNFKDDGLLFLYTLNQYIIENTMICRVHCPGIPGFFSETGEKPGIGKSGFLPLDWGVGGSIYRLKNICVL